MEAFRTEAADTMTADTSGAERALASIRLRLVDSADEVSAGDVLAGVLRQAQVAIGALATIDPDVLDVVDCRRWLEGIERTRRMTEAVSVTAAGHVDRANPFRRQGFFSATTVLKHMLQLSGPETHRRLQTARMQRRLPDWADAEGTGDVGVAQTELMARVAANPRVPSATLRRDQNQLLDDARLLPFDDFDRNIRTWEALADAEGDRDRNDRQRQRRDVMLRPDDGYGWTLTGNLPEPDGNEFMSIFAHFVEAEWHTDWADARARVGDDATVDDLSRTEPQRRADALLAMARAAASTPPGSTRPTSTVSILIDQASLETHLRGDAPSPVRYRDVVCRTRSGRRLHPDDVLNTALVDHVRRVVYDSAGTVTDLGRRSRLFRGSSREAVMLLHTTCAWVGCDRPIDWCDADHSRSWKAHGATVPRNGSPLCGAHNRLKERGFHVHRDAEGDWHFTDAGGNAIN